MSETGPWTFQIVDVFFGSRASTYSLYFECGYLDCLHCVSFRFSLYRDRFKIALKYLKNNLRRPFENCKFTPLDHLQVMVTVELQICIHVL